MASSPITSEQTYGKKNANIDRLDFGGVPKSLKMVIAAMKLKETYSLGEKL